MTERPSLAVLPIEARRAAWNELWRRLLAPPTSGDPTPEATRDEAPDDEASDDEASDEAA